MNDSSLLKHCPFEDRPSHVNRTTNLPFAEHVPEPTLHPFPHPFPSAFNPDPQMLMYSPLPYFVFAYTCLTTNSVTSESIKTKSGRRMRKRCFIWGDYIAQIKESLMREFCMILFKDERFFLKIWKHVELVLLLSFFYSNSPIVHRGLQDIFHDFLENIELIEVKQSFDMIYLG